MRLRLMSKYRRQILRGITLGSLVNHYRQHERSDIFNGTKPAAEGAR